jgi:Domain of unknown function (DUF397)
VYCHHVAAVLRNVLRNARVRVGRVIVWRKSSYSDGNGGACVETSTGDAVILIRDTTDRDGMTLSIPADAWRRFTASLS